MKKVLIVGVFFFVFVPGAAGTGDLSAVRQRADELWRNRFDPGRTVEAVEAYEEVLRVDPGDIEAAVRAAYGYWWAGRNAIERENKLALLEKGMEAADRVITMDEKNPAGHFWKAVNTAEYGKTRGIIKSLFLLGPIKQELRRLAELDDGYLFGGYYRVFGKIYCAVPGIAGGSKKKCVEHLEKAVEIGSPHLVNHLFLAEAYLETGQEEKAIAVLEFIRDAPLEPDYIPDDTVYKKEAGELLEKIRESK